MKSTYNKFIARIRWIKKYLPFLVPEVDKIKISDKLTIFYSLKDVAGPSFDIGYDRLKAFENYEILDKSLLLKYLKNNSVFFDIGANIGHFSFYFKEKYPRLECHLFEPVPKLANCITQTIKESQIQDVTLHQLGLSSITGEATFFIDDYNDGGHSLKVDKVSKKSRKGTQLTIKTFRLDDYFSSMNLNKVDVLKVDIQGAEFDFIEGAKETLKKYRPIMLIEVDSHAVGKFLTLLKECVGDIYDVFTSEEKPIKDEKKIIEIEAEYQADGKKEGNFLFLPKS